MLAVVSLILSAVQFNRTKESLLEVNPIFSFIVTISEREDYDIVDTTVNRNTIKNLSQGVTDTVASHTLRVTPSEVEEVIQCQ